MATIAIITELHPVHGVLALANVTMGDRTFEMVQLGWDDRMDQYRIHPFPFFNDLDDNLKQKITDALSAKYERKLQSRRHSRDRTNMEVLEERRIYDLRRRRRRYARLRLNGIDYMRELHLSLLFEF